MTDQTRLSPARGVKAIATFTSLLCIVEAFRFHSLTYVNPDAGWLLHVASRTMNGAVPYRDLIEINPPLILWMLYPVVWLSTSTGLNVELVYSAGIGLMAVGAIMLSVRLLGPEERWTALPLLAFIAFVVPARDFGQREHLLVLCLFPYLSLVIRRLRSDPISIGTAVLVGAFAAVGFALKPHFGLIWLGASVYLAWRHGWRQFIRLPETVTVFAAAPAYLLAISLWAPDYWVTVREFGSLYLAFIPFPIPYLLLDPVSLFACLIVVLWVVVRSKTGDSPVREVLAIAAIGAVVGAVVQGKGFPYHYLPALSFGILLAAGLAGRWRPATITTGLLAVIAAQVIVHRHAVDWRDLNRRDSPLAHLEFKLQSVLQPEDHIAFLMWRLGDAWPISFYLGEAFVYPMPSLWWMRAVYPVVDADDRPTVFHAPADMGATERSLFEMTVNNLIESQPGLIVMPRGSGMGGVEEISDYEFDIARYLSQDARAATLLKRYTLELTHGRLAIWRRIEDISTGAQGTVQR